MINRLLLHIVNCICVLNYNKILHYCKKNVKDPTVAVDKCNE